MLRKLLLLFLPSYLFGAIPNCSIEPQLVSRFPVNLATGQLVYSNHQEVEVAGEKVVINYEYKSPKVGEIGRWNSMGYLFLEKVDLEKGQYFAVYDLEGRSEIFVSDQKNKGGICDDVTCIKQSPNVTCQVEEDQVTVNFGCGRKRIYEKAREKWLEGYYRLIKERTSKGNWLHYYYLSQIQILRVDVVCGKTDKVVGSVHFKYLTNRLEDPSVIVSVNGEQKLFYRYKKFGMDFHLSSIEGSCGVIELFGYRERERQHKRKRQVFRLNKVEFPNGTYLGFVYRKNDHKIDSVWGKKCGRGRVQLAKMSYEEKKSVLVLGDGRSQEYHFDSRGRTIFARWGSVEQRSEYNEYGCLTKRISVGGRGGLLERQITYDNSLNVTCDCLMANGERVETHREYDKLGRVQTILHSNGLEESFTYLGETSLVVEHRRGETRRKYKYNEMGDLIFEEEESGKFVHNTRIYTLNEGRVTQVEVGTVGRESNQYECDHIEKYSYDQRGNLLLKQTVDRVGNVTFEEEFSYTKQNNVKEKISSSGAKVSFTYDQASRLVREESQNLVTEYEYDSCGRVVRRVRSCSGEEDRTTHYHYDCFGRLISLIDERGYVTEYAYDKFDRRVKDERGVYAYDIFGKLAYQRDNLGNETRIINGLYDEPLEIVHPDSSVNECRCEQGGRKKVFVDGDGYQKVCYYDELSRLVRSEFEGRIIENRYSGDKITEIRENGIVVAQFTYDALGRIEEEDRLGRIRKYSYNHVGQLSHLEEDGRVTIFNRDGLGRVVKKWVGKSVYTYEYDESGECISWERGEADEKVAWRHEYNGFGDLRIEYAPSGGATQYVRAGSEMTKIDPLDRATRHRYNQQGLLEEQGVESFTYDTVGQVVAHARETDGSSIEARFSYDPMGRLTRVEDCYGTREKGYSKRGEVVWERRENGTLVEYEYNPHGELVHVKSEDGTLEYRYTYNANGDVIEAKNEVSGRSTFREYDHNRRLVKEVFENGGEIKFEYIGGHKSAIILPDGTSIHYVYDAGEVCRIYRSDGRGEFLYDALVELDSRGKVKRETMIKNLGVIEKRYDRDLRLKMISSPYHFETVTTRDLAGNILGIVGSEREEKFQVDQLDQIVGSIPTNTFYQRSVAPRRDGGGRVVEQGGRHFFYDGFDRLTRVNFEGRDVHFVHDAFNRIVMREEGGEIDRYIYDELIEIGRLDREGEIRELRVLGYGKRGDIGRSVAFEIDDHLYAPLHDLFGNVIGVVDSATGKVAEKWQTSIFGVEDSGSSKLVPWRFGSKRVDPLGDLILFGFRIYLPSAATFCQLDEREAGCLTNLTHFNFNNPLRFCDVWGLDSTSEGRDSGKLSLDNLLVSPRYPFSDWLVERALSRGGEFVVDSKDIKHFPGRESCDRDSALVVVNGIRNTPGDCEQLAKKVARKYSGKLVSIYNRTGGTWSDLNRVTTELVNQDTAPVINLRTALIDLHEQGYQNIHLINHSEGGLIARRALEKLSTEVRSKLNIVSFASPSVIPRCYAKSVANYYSEKDSIRCVARLSCLIDTIAGHAVDVECFQSQMGKFGEHSIHSPTYSFLLDQVLESIEGGG